VTPLLREGPRERDNKENLVRHGKRALRLMPGGKKKVGRGRERLSIIKAKKTTDHPGEKVARVTRKRKVALLLSAKAALQEILRRGGGRVHHGRAGPLW